MFHFFQASGLSATIAKLTNDATQRWYAQDNTVIDRTIQFDLFNISN